jgi:hypothetical protein
MEAFFQRAELEDAGNRKSYGSNEPGTEAKPGPRIRDPLLTGIRDDGDKTESRPDRQIAR